MPTPKKKKKLTRVSFDLPPAKALDSDTDCYEEPESPEQPLQAKEKENFPSLGNEREPGSVKTKTVNEPSVEELETLHGIDIEDRQYYATVGRGRSINMTKRSRMPPLLPRRKENAPLTEEKENCSCTLNDLEKPSGPPEFCPAVWAQIEKEAREMEEEDRLITKMKEGRGRGRGTRIFNGRPPVIIRKEIPHCRAIPLSLASRGALSRPAHGRDYSCCSGIPGFGIGRGQGRGILY